MSLTHSHSHSLYVFLCCRVNSFQSDEENAEEEVAMDGNDDFTFDYHNPSCLTALGRDSPSLSKSGGSLRWSTLRTLI
eukprot:COSAG02_NODE_8694_length_2477_cov_2.194281_4_plen_77_part_01